MNDTDNRPNKPSNIITRKTIFWVVLIAAILVGLVVFSSREQNSQPTTANTNPAPATVPAPVATLSLDPAANTVKVGDTFSVNVVLDTAQTPIDGVDLYAVHFDPKILNVVDSNAKQSGIQITPGTILAVSSANSVDQKNGKIIFSQLSTGGTTFSGKGVLATIQFKAVGAGVSDVKFDFTPGSTTDTNAAHAGMDQLQQVMNGTYTVIAK